MSADSVQRITEGFGAAIAEVRSSEVAQVHELGAAGESPRTSCVQPVAPISDRASISSDGVMILVRQEGWKEVKVTAISQVEVRSAGERTVQTGRRGDDPLIHLHHSSYQAGLWDADTMAKYQYAEGLRRGLQNCPILSSANDAAGWIDRITTANFPGIVSVVDWTHAAQRVWAAANAAFDQNSPATQPWVDARLDALWSGKALDVASAIAALNLDTTVAHQAQGYFESYHLRMNYPAFRSAGYPIGSGAVEGANRSVVQQRMKCPGQGWCRHNAQSVLAALCELHSDRFEIAWKSVPYA